MKLIGMLDSPFVRRVAITLQQLDLPFEHLSLSVFRDYSQFQALSPVVKAPSLICDDGNVLIDSNLIIDYLESLTGRSLMPADPAARVTALRITGLALVACEKSVQLVYEDKLRPAEVKHRPWIERLTQQLNKAYLELEKALSELTQPADMEDFNQATISAAVAWQFTQQMLPGMVEPPGYPALSQLSATAERLPAFRHAPYGEATYPVEG